MSLQVDSSEPARDRVEPADAPAEDPDVADPEYGPSRLTQLTAVGLAVLVPLGFRGAGLVVGLLGAGLLTVDVVRGRRTMIHAGGGLQLAGISVAAVQGAAVDTVLLATVLAIVAWDVGRYGIAVGDQLGRTALTTRIEVAHTVWSVGVGLVALLVLYGLSAIVSAGSSDAMWVLLIGVVVLVVGLLVDR